MGLCDAAELRLPVAVEDDRVDVALCASPSARGLSLDVLKFTCAVDPVGLKGSSIAFTGCTSALFRVIAAVMISQALSARSGYTSCAGYVPPLQTR